MGQAKRNQDRLLAIDQRVPDIDFARIAGAVSRLCEAASGNLGTDCLLQAGLAQSILTRLEVPSEVRAGFAAFRVGPGDGDVIAHRPDPRTIARLGDPREVPFHAWIQVGSFYFDPSTRQLPIKARQLDELDGGHTTVQWAPPYLLVRRDATHTHTQVAQGSAGLVYYEVDDAVERRVLRTDIGYLANPEDQARAWLAYQNPEMVVFGPNNTQAMGET